MDSTPIAVRKTSASCFQMDLSWCDQDILGKETSFVNNQDRHDLVTIESLTMHCKHETKH